MDIEQFKATIGKRLRTAREERDLSQEDVAQKLGVTTGAYGAFERGTNLIAVNYLIDLSRILNKSLLYFFPPLISNHEMNDAQHDPLLRELIDLWPYLNDELKRATVNLVRHAADHNPHK